jgi:hypothetical protein
MIPIDVLVKAQTEDQVMESFLTRLEAIKVPARSWRKGGSLRSILRIVAKTYAGFTEVMAAFIKSGFLETATGNWLTLLALYVYGVVRREATFATGDLLFTNNGGGVYAYGPDEVRALSPDTKKAYVNSVAFTLNPGESKLVAIRAVEIGAGSSAPIGTITQLETNMPVVVITNPKSVVGLDEEADGDLRQACKDRLGTFSLMGPRGAYAFAAKRALRPDGAFVNINRVTVSSDPNTGVVTVYVAAPSGAPDPLDITYARASIEEIARPDSVTANCFGAIPLPIEASSIVAWARRVDGVAAGDLKLLSEDALNVQVSEYPIGGIKKPPSPTGKLYSDFVKGTIKGSHPTFFDVDGFDVDISLAANEVAVLAAAVEVRVIDTGAS